MFTLKIENKSHQILTLTHNESDYQVVNIEGLNPPDAQIYTNAIAGMDGEKFKSSKLNMRNIVLTIFINGNIEENRLRLYEYFRTGQWCNVYFSNGSRNVHIEGYCENVACPLFDMRQKMQISIVCPNPYLVSLQTIYADISKQFANFEFPFAIEEEGIEFSRIVPDREVMIINGGEAESGMRITLTARNGNVAYPVIYNVDTSEYLKVNAVMQEGDVIVIDTSKGKKSIKLISDAVETNIINTLEAGSTWFQLRVGATTFTYSATYGELTAKVEIESNLLYEGV